MSRLLRKLGGVVTGHPRLVLGLWVVAVAALVVGAKTAGPETGQNLTLPGTGSTKAADLLAKRLPADENGSVPIVLRSDHSRLDSGSNAQAVKATVKSLDDSPQVRSTVSPLSGQGASQLSKDGKIGYIAVTLHAGPEDLDESDAEAVFAAADPARDTGLEVSAGGYLGQELSKPDTGSSDEIGVAAAIVLLLLAFGTAVAMAMPIATAIIGLATGLSLIALLGHVVSVPDIAPTLGTMLGLGVGIDYSLFIVTRHRENLQAGQGMRESIVGSLATSGSAVVFAGGTVVIALLALAVADIPIVSALGYSASLSVVAAVIAAATLLPALLMVVGHRIESLRLPFGRFHEHDPKPRGWARWAGGVAARPWLAALAGIAILVTLALPVLDIRLGQVDVSEQPESTTANQAYAAITDGFGVGANGPFLIAVKLDPPAKPDTKKLNQFEQQQDQQQQAVDAGQAPPPTAAEQQQASQQQAFLMSPASDSRLVKLQNQIKKDKRVDSVSPAQLDSSGNAAVFTATPTTSPSAEATANLVVQLRDDVIPQATKGTGLTAYVGGVTAGNVDLADRIGEKLPLVIAVVVALSFILLTVAFRSLVVPATAAIMNLLSVAAAYGVLTAVFEKGWGVELIGLDHSIPIVSFVPLLMFAILFGLSMDYQVFLVSRIREHYAETKDNGEAVVDGLASSARVITSAALIMVAVFTSFVLNGDPTVKQFGVGLAVAIALDATVVRCLLVPAVMVLMGRANWWFPGRLERVLPRLGVDE